MFEVHEEQYSLFDFSNAEKMVVFEEPIKKEPLELISRISCETILTDNEINCVAENSVLNPNFINIVSQYKESCIRIVESYGGALLVEDENETIHFNSKGNKELVLKKDIALLPMDSIIICNKDKEANEKQMSILKKISPEKYIKRKGDANIIIPGDDTTVINPLGWVLQYKQKVKFKDDEVFILQDPKRADSVDIVDEVKINETVSIESSIYDKIKVGTKVEAIYSEKTIVGNVTSIYNGRETFNIEWDGKSTAFYYKSIKKICND